MTALSLVSAGALRAAPSARGHLVIQGGTVHIGNGDVLSPGTVVVKDGKITAVVSSDQPLELPAGAVVLDATGKHVFPGLIDADSQLLAEASATVGAGRVTLDVRDGLNPFYPYDRDAALAQGVTTVHVSARANGLWGGSGVVVKLAPQGALKDHVLASGLGVGLDLDGDRRASSRMRNYEAIRKQFADARKYVEAWEEYDEKLKEYTEALEKLRKEEAKAEEKDKSDKGKGGGDKPKEGDQKPAPPEGKKPDEKPKPEPKPDEPKPDKPKPDGLPRFVAELVGDAALADGPPRRGGNGGEDAKGAGDKKDDKKKEEEKAPEKPARPKVDPENEVLREVLEGKRTVHARARDAADVLNLLDLHRQFQFRLVLVGGDDAAKVSADLESAEVPVLLGVEPDASRPEDRARAARLEEASVNYAITSPGRSARETRDLGLCAAAAVAGGLDAERALAAVTSRPARILGVSQRVGTLEPGKDADLVIASAEPFSSLSVVEQVLIDGAVVYKR